MFPTRTALCQRARILDENSLSGRGLASSSYGLPLTGSPPWARCSPTWVRPGISTSLGWEALCATGRRSPPVHSPAGPDDQNATDRRPDMRRCSPRPCVKVCSYRRWRRWTSTGRLVEASPTTFHQFPSFLCLTLWSSLVVFGVSCKSCRLWKW